MNFTLILLFVLIASNLVLFIKKMKQQKEIDYAKYIKEVAENGKDIVYYCTIEPVFKYIYLSPAIETVLGQNVKKRAMEDPYTLFEICHLDDYSILEKKFSGNLDYNEPIIMRWKNEQGNYLWFEDLATPVYKNGKLIAIHGIIRNIDKTVAITKKLKYIAYHDVLTNIYNRHVFEELMEQYNQHINVPMTIVVCDVDRLKYANDHFGHIVGDQLIKDSANILSKYSNDKDIYVMRIGGDEFVMMLINKNRKEAEHFIEVIQKEIEDYNRKSGEIQLDLSFGYSYSDTSIGKMHQLLMEADLNMYRQKRKKKRNSEEVVPR